jgi:hypothetical protein
MWSGNAVNAFVYTGEGGNDVPQNVVRVRVDPSVTSIPAKAFHGRKKLAEVELCEGLVEIGEESFGGCDHSITKINIPTSLRRINDWAFRYSLRCPICLHDGIESIGTYSFACCIFTNFRVPPLITVIPEGMLSNCKALFSLELSKNVRRIGNYAFANCNCLRNVAFPPNADLVDDILGGQGQQIQPEWYDLHQLFGSISELTRALQHRNRFDGLLIHSIVYYQSYNQEVLQNLMEAIKFDATGNQQDCLGMTPLHILTCSSVHDLEVYRVIVEKYPANLITEDRWGATPLLYAFWGAAPAEIIIFLLESYESLYPDHVFNWTMMIETMGRCDTPKESIEYLLSVKQMHYPEQPIDWDHLLDEFARTAQFVFRSTFTERLRFLVMCSLADRVEALAFKVWRDHIIDMIHTANFQCNGNNNQAILSTIQVKVTHFEEELPKLKETTTILELALWKLRMNKIIQAEKMIQDNIGLSIRKQSRITCGADVIIRHVLPYLISTNDEESD